MIENGVHILAMGFLGLIMNQDEVIFLLAVCNVFGAITFVCGFGIYHLLRAK